MATNLLNIYLEKSGIRVSSLIVDQCDWLRPVCRSFFSLFFFIGVKDLEIQKISSKFTIDVIAEAAFGVDSKSFSTVQSDFEQRSNSLVLPLSLTRMARFLILLASPTLGKLFGLKFISQESDDYFSSIIKGENCSQLVVHNQK